MTKMMLMVATRASQVEEVEAERAPPTYWPRASQVEAVEAEGAPLHFAWVNVAAVKAVKQLRTLSCTQLRVAGLSSPGVLGHKAVAGGCCAHGSA